MGLFMELWKLTVDANRNDTSSSTTRSKLEKQQSVADEVVVVMRFL
jgi:hypothetical protein